MTLIHPETALAMTGPAVTNPVLLAALMTRITPDLPGNASRIITIRSALSCRDFSGREWQVASDAR